MKKTLYIFLFFFGISYHAAAQQPSVINFVTSKIIGSNTFTIFLNGKLITTLNKGENLEYTIYSAGRISVNAMLTPLLRYNETIDVTPGNVYYFELGYFTKSTTKVVSEARGKKLYEKNKLTVKQEEDKNNPIGIIPATP